MPLSTNGKRSVDPKVKASTIGGVVVGIPSSAAVCELAVQIRPGLDGVACNVIAGAVLVLVSFLFGWLKRGAPVTE